MKKSAVGEAEVVLKKDDVQRMQAPSTPIISPLRIVVDGILRAHFYFLFLVATGQSVSVRQGGRAAVVTFYFVLFFSSIFRKAVNVT